MAHDNDDLDDIPSIIPERDEVVNHRKRRRGTSATNAPKVHEVFVSRTSGPVIFLLSVLFIGMIGTGAAGYYFYSEGLAMQGELLNARTRIGQLENRLNLVDEAQSESALNLVERVDFNFSEIDKLWAARNALRSEVGGLKEDMTRVQTVSKELQETVASHSRTLDENVVAIQARIDEINRNFAGMDNLGDQLTALNADLNRVKVSMNELREDVTSNLGAYEQDIESINVYRLQLNQTIQAMERDIDQLQQLVGRPAATTGSGGP